MSRHLPIRPNLEYLRKEAKELLPALRRTAPDCRLADAQRVLASEYGFSSWSELKAHVQALPAASVPLSDIANPFVGKWRANLSKSTRHPDNPFESATLEFEVLGNTVTITDVVVDATGREEHGRNTLHVDGLERLREHGYVVAATWLDPRVLEAVVTKAGRIEGRVQYALSADGNTLTLSAGEHVTIFNRE
jgi:hypothetical protein